MVCREDEGGTNHPLMFDTVTHTGDTSLEQDSHLEQGLSVLDTQSALVKKTLNLKGVNLTLETRILCNRAHTPP